MLPTIGGGVTRTTNNKNGPRQKAGELILSFYLYERLLLRSPFCYSARFSRYRK
jgi:hypothetical protein